MGDEDNTGVTCHYVTGIPIPPEKATNKDISDENSREKGDNTEADHYRKNICAIRELVKSVEKKKEKGIRSEGR